MKGAETCQGNNGYNSMYEVIQFRQQENHD